MSRVLSHGLFSGPLFIRETVYGIVKRLDFFIQNIEAYRKREGLNSRDILILDVGCGTGVNVTIPLAQAGYTVVGLDSDAASIERARKLSIGFDNVQFHCGSLGSQPSAESFTVVICSEVLEHLKEPDVFVKDMGSVLKPDGLLLVTVPNGFGFFELDSFFWRLVCRSEWLVSKLYGLENKCWRLFGSSRTLQRRKDEYDPERLQLTWSTLAPNTDHDQFYTSARITTLIKNQGFRILELRNNTLLAGNLLGLLFRELDSILYWNSRVADKIPYCLASGWLIAARKSPYPRNV